MAVGDITLRDNGTGTGDINFGVAVGPSPGLRGLALQGVGLCLVAFLALRRWLAGG